MFINITTNTAIYFTNENNNFLNSDCLFINCSSDRDSGSIYFKCDSSIVQYRTCGYKSQINFYGAHHSSVKLVDKSNNKNYLYDSSFYECGNLENGCTNYLRGGNIEVKSINTSFCEAKSWSRITLNIPTNLGKVSHSSFCNTTSHDLIIELYSGNFNFNFCNVLNNEHTDSDSVTFYASNSKVLIDHCSFFGNTGPGAELMSLFDFDYDHGITVQNSYGDRFDQVPEGINIIYYFNFERIYSIQSLSHFSTHLCEARFITKCKGPDKSASDAFHHLPFYMRRVR